MICISNRTNGHVGPAGSSFIPDEYLKTISHAFKVLLNEMHDAKACNDEFRSQPGGRAFKDMLDDASIWINYDSTNNGALWGWTIPPSFPNDLVITKYALGMGHWSTAATIVHELAHLNGAPGGSSHSAEHTVKACRMRSRRGPYDSHVVGSVVQRRDTRII